MENREPKNQRTGAPRTKSQESEIENQSSLQSTIDNVQSATDNGQPTTNNKEQIGALIYLPNADYPYPFPSERPPHYWMTEQTGKLAEAVESYFAAERLDTDALDLIRQYLLQYIERAIMTGDANRNLLLNQVTKLRTVRAIESFAEELAEIGVEPF